MRRRAARSLLTFAAGAGLCGTACADRPELGAYIDLQQFADVQLQGAGNDDVTYSEITAGATAQVRNRRVVVSFDYRLAYRIPEYGDIGKSISHDGVGRAQAQLVDDWLTLDAGVLATHSRIDPSGAAPQLSSPNAKNITQTYAYFVQPGIAHRMGDVTLAAAYRYGYTRNEGSQAGFSVGPRVNRFDSSTSQMTTFSVGMDNSPLPFDWNIASEYRHENTTNLAQHFRSINVIGEITLPIADTVALVSSGGYEKSRSTEGVALVNPLTGVPVAGRDGRFIVDPTMPRVLTYDVAGLVADGGVIWKPSRRTRFEARAGYRYGGLTVSGLVEMRPSERSGLTMIVFDRIQSFGQGVTGGLASSPADLDLDQTADPGSPYQNCLFGKGAGSGNCIGGALGQASASSYRERGMSAIFSRRLRQWVVSSTLGYTHRTYIDQPGTLFSLDGVVDQSYFGDFTMSGQLTRVSGISFSFSGNLFKNGQVGASDVTSGSFRSSYYRSFGRGIKAQASVAIEASKQDGVTADVSGRAQLGVRYQF